MRMYQNQESKIYGFNGPFFPSAVDILNGHFLRVADSLARTERLCKALGNITGVPPVTDDYPWACGVETVGSHILIPDFGDPGTWDGRSIALYDKTRTDLAVISANLETPMEIVNRVAERAAITGK